jgi:hypothetical protein
LADAATPIRCAGFTLTTRRPAPSTTIEHWSASGPDGLGEVYLGPPALLARAASLPVWGPFPDLRTGRINDGRAFVAIPGSLAFDLEELAARLAPGAAVAFAWHVGSALAEVHERGGAHGALHPAFVGLDARGKLSIRPAFAATLPAETDPTASAQATDCLQYGHLIEVLGLDRLDEPGLPLLRSGLTKDRARYRIAPGRAARQAFAALLARHTDWEAALVESLGVEWRLSNALRMPPRPVANPEIAPVRVPTVGQAEPARVLSVSVPSSGAPSRPWSAPVEAPPPARTTPPAQAVVPLSGPPPAAAPVAFAPQSTASLGAAAPPDAPTPAAGPAAPASRGPRPESPSRVFSRGAGLRLTVFPGPNASFDDEDDDDAPSAPPGAAARPAPIPMPVPAAVAMPAGAAPAQSEPAPLTDEAEVDETVPQDADPAQAPLEATPAGAASAGVDAADPTALPPAPAPSADDAPADHAPAAPPLSALAPSALAPSALAPSALAPSALAPSALAPSAPAPSAPPTPPALDPATADAALPFSPAAAELPAPRAPWSLADAPPDPGAVDPVDAVEDDEDAEDPPTRPDGLPALDDSDALPDAPSTGGEASLLAAVSAGLAQDDWAPEPSAPPPRVPAADAEAEAEVDPLAGDDRPWSGRWDSPARPDDAVRGPAPAVVDPIPLARAFPSLQMGRSTLAPSEDDVPDVDVEPPPLARSPLAAAAWAPEPAWSGAPGPLRTTEAPSAPLAAPPPAAPAWAPPPTPAEPLPPTTPEQPKWEGLRGVTGDARREDELGAGKWTESARSLAEVQGELAAGPPREIEPLEDGKGSKVFLIIGLCATAGLVLWWIVAG